MNDYIPTTGEVRDALEAWMWTSRPYRPELTSADPSEALDRLLDQVRREAKAEALCDFADSTRMPFVVFRRDDGSPVYVGDLMREVAANYRADQLEQEGKNDE
ncbi:hypothetical protein [Citricoccus sp. NR2]|uniref:hypothetical protein n=1 Tax=Citricoccus sp. NR2 TaxID=3004095 RepID=UPI0022DD59FC|nr:hypothetical protein [Citricoccus sp. NR2]WBL18498.1 hypothetical protein O1A05_12120 [Citricoccus sp. NR2]